MATRRKNAAKTTTAAVEFSEALAIPGSVALVLAPGHIIKYVPFAGDDPTTTLETLQRLVGGNIESVPRRSDDETDAPQLWAYVNEDGVNKELPGNDLGGSVLERAGFDICWVLLGPVVIVGVDDRPLDGEAIRFLDAKIKEVLGVN